jgi:thioredoxin-dependent peroxiredoxin
MAKTKFKGNDVNLAGEMPKPGSQAPSFRLLKTDLSELTNKDIAGKTTILLTVPSVDTGVCATETRKFNEKATSVPGVLVVVASHDTPFALKRFCAAEGIANVHGGSVVRDPEFDARWGVGMKDGPLAGFTARAAFVIDPAGKVKYSQLVPEITQEPDYDAILAAAR